MISTNMCSCTTGKCWWRDCSTAISFSSVASSSSYTNFPRWLGIVLSGGCCAYGCCTCKHLMFSCFNPPHATWHTKSLRVDVLGCWLSSWGRPVPNLAAEHCGKNGISHGHPTPAWIQVNHSAAINTWNFWLQCNTSMNSPIGVSTNSAWLVRLVIGISD